jgi:hypothetical protein
MTKILLARGSEQQTLDFDPACQPWKRQQADFLVGFATGLPGVFARVFVKRQKVRPPGHDLLLALRGRAVPGLPCFYGHAAEGGFHYYVFESLPSAFVLVDHVLYGHTALRPADLICEPFIMAVVDQSAQSFTALLAENHVYTDFSTKNILADDGRQIRLIDVDSSWPLATLQRNRHPTGVQFDATFWALWNTQVAARSPGGEARAPQTLVLSFAAVWLRALALKAAGDANGAVALVKAAGAASQEGLWSALARADRQGFVDYFQLTDPRTPAYDAWSRIFTALRAGNPVAWGEIQAAAQALAASIKAGVVRAPAAALRPVITRPRRAAAGLAGPLATLQRLVNGQLADRQKVALVAVVCVGLLLATRWGDQADGSIPATPKPERSAPPQVIDAAPPPAAGLAPRARPTPPPVAWGDVAAPPDAPGCPAGQTVDHDRPPDLSDISFHHLFNSVRRKGVRWQRRYPADCSGRSVFAWDDKGRLIVHQVFAAPQLAHQWQVAYDENRRGEAFRVLRSEGAGNNIVGITVYGCDGGQALECVALTDGQQRVLKKARVLRAGPQWSIDIAEPGRTRRLDGASAHQYLRTNFYLFDEVARE